MVYVFGASCYYLPLTKLWVTIGLYLINGAIWGYSNAHDKRHYERWHPWLHITVAGTIHFYQKMAIHNG